MSAAGGRLAVLVALGALAGCQYASSSRFSAVSPSGGPPPLGSAIAPAGEEGQASDANGSDPVAPIPPPTITSPAAGATLLVGRTTLVEIAPYPAADWVSCALYRGQERLATYETDHKKTTPCEVKDLSPEWVGEAELVCTGYAHETDQGSLGMGPATRRKVTVTLATPQPGPTPEWNGHYSSAVTGKIVLREATLKNGALTGAFKVKDDRAGEIAFAPFTVKVDPDGTIVPQQVPLTPQSLPVNTSDDSRKYLASTKALWVSGGATTVSGANHVVQLRLFGPTLKGASSMGGFDLVWSEDAQLWRDDAQKPVVTGGPSSGGHGHGGGDDACKKACFHAEATCHGRRADCMKTRQGCVKSCS